MMYQKYVSIILFLLFTESSIGQNTVCFTIEDNPDINSIAYSDFTKYVRVLDCFNIYAESSIPDAKVLHAASIAAELLDNNEDGEVDDPLLKDELNANGALIPIFAYDGSPAMDNFFDNYNGNGAAAVLWRNEIDPNNPGYWGADATVEEIALAEHGLEVVQSLDPSGIGARDLSECLRIQVVQGTQPNGRLDWLSNTDKNDLLLLIDEHIDDLTHNRLPVVQKKTGLSINRIDELVALIGELDPMPGARFVDHHNQAVTADLVLHESEDGEYSVTVEDSWVPTIRISRYYRERLSDPTATKEEKEYIRRKVNAAQWLVDAIQQRRSTLKSVAEAIVDVQQEFLKHGPERIVPLKMQQIADVVGVHVTTVSRAVDDKWMQTPRGLYPLKRFFVGGTVGEDGEDVAWDIIRIKLQELIDQENKAKPHSDDELVRRLKEAGMTVARRTITKYRKKMGIPSSRQRKDWSLVEKKRKS